MSSRTTRTADSKPTRSSVHLGQKRPPMLSLAEPTKKVEDDIPLPMSVPPMHRRAQAMLCPMTPMTPELDIDDSPESPGSSQSSSASSTFTFNLLSPSTPYYENGFSFTACPSSPLLGESTVYAFPPRDLPTAAGFPTGFRKFSADHNEFLVVFDSPLSEDAEFQSPSDDRKHFHVQFLQEDSPFPKSPDC